MASKNEDLKVIRCTYFELKQVADSLEKPRGKSRKSSRTTSASPVKKTAERSRDEAKTSVKKTTSPGKECEISRQSKPSLDQTRKGKDKVPEKLSGSPKKKPSSKKTAAKDQNRDINKNGLITTIGNSGRVTSPKIVRFDVQNGKESSGIEDDISEYDRGLILPNRLLYDPSNSKHSKGEVDDKTSGNDLVNMMDKLRTYESPTRRKSNLSASPTKSPGQANPKKVNKRIAETLLTDASYLEADLDNLLSRRINTKEQLDRVTKLSLQIQEKCKTIMETDLYVFTTKEVYLLLWRSGIYQVIERLRALQKSEEDETWSSDVSEILQEFLDATNVFVHGLITSLENKNEFSLKSFLDSPNQFDNSSRSVKMALLSCHHFMIFLGDIERYKQHLSSSKEWSVARSCYLKAIKIAPRNGKPYNQLAVIAVYAKRRLDAVYYYIRSLCVSNPIMTAREKLHAIYDDVQRKAYVLHTSATQMEKERQAHENERTRDMTAFGPGSRRRNSGARVQDRKTMEKGRHELWVFYQSGTRREYLFTPTGMIEGKQNEMKEKKDKASSKISLNEISKQFEIFFLYCHAMLYSKIGIDHFLENRCKTMGLFRTLLRHPRNPAVKMNRLVEMMAINMFEVENLAEEDHGQFMEGTPLDLALNLGCEMSQCLCKVTSDIITSSEDSSGQDICQLPALTNYIPAIKVWFDWIQINVSLLRSSSISIKEEFWSSTASLLNNLKGIFGLEISSDTPGEVLQTLPEDDHLNGFRPLAEVVKQWTKVGPDLAKEMVCSQLRTEALQSIAKFLCEFEDLPLRYDEASQRYYVTEIITTSEISQATGNEIDEADIDDDDDDDVIVESVEDIDSDSELPSHVRELKAKKDALTKEILSQKQREEEAKAVLVAHSNKPTLVLEINPQYLVPDTNCFIDHLPELQYIVESKYFTVVMPLVVINELDGLAKGFADAEQRQRTDFVASQARAAVDFLEYRFSLSDSQMLALTSKGSVLTTIAFRSEEPTAGRGINDDIILNCCTHYCDAKMDVVNKLATADQPFTVRRKVVLLTEDRNLRLKAHVQNIPVVTVPQFLEMIVP